MFLAVQEKTTKLDYHGIPIREFLADDLGIEDVFIIVAANYLNSLQPLFQHGFVRRLETKRVEAIQASGRIDIERSLRNNQLSKGVPKQHFIQREVNYNVTVNSLVYRAGVELLRLFQLYSQDYLHSGYFRVFSQLEDALRRMEKYGKVDDQITPRQAAELLLMIYTLNGITIAMQFRYLKQYYRLLLVNLLMREEKSSQWITSSVWILYLRNIHSQYSNLKLKSYRMIHDTLKWTRSRSTKNH